GAVRRQAFPDPDARPSPPPAAARRDRAACRRPGAIRKRRPPARPAVLMRRLVTIGLLLIALPARAQIPAEWQAAAQVVIGEFERDTPQAAKPWSGELRQGWSLARAWRQHNNGN